MPQKNEISGVRHGSSVTWLQRAPTARHLLSGGIRGRRFSLRACERKNDEAPKPIDSDARPRLTITPEPNGAEIEIDGEFVGNTPTTLTTHEILT
jgi:hypothetical protein